MKLSEVMQSHFYLYPYLFFKGWAITPTDIRFLKRWYRTVSLFSVFVIAGSFDPGQRTKWGCVGNAAFLASGLRIRTSGKEPGDCDLLNPQGRWGLGLGLKVSTGFLKRHSQYLTCNPGRKRLSFSTTRSSATLALRMDLVIPPGPGPTSYTYASVRLPAFLTILSGEKEVSVILIILANFNARH